MDPQLIFADGACLDNTTLYSAIHKKFNNVDWKETPFAEYANVLISPNFELVMSWLQQSRFETAEIYLLTFHKLPTEMTLVDARTIDILE